MRLNLNLFLTDYSLRPCALMGPGGFLVGFCTIPGTVGWAFRWMPEQVDSPLYWEVSALIWLVALWVFVRGVLNSLTNSFQWPLEEMGLLTRPTAQLLSVIPMFVGTLAGWHSIQTETFGLAILSGVVTMVVWFQGWCRILATRD